MGKVGKPIMPGQGSRTLNTPSSLSKSSFKAKKNTRQLPYFSDPLLIPRVNQYLSDHKDKVYVDINDMVDELQSKYKEYSRRKRAAFKPLVEKAFSVVLQQCGMSGQDNSALQLDTSSSEVEECDTIEERNQSGVSNSQLLNLYRPSQLQAMVKQYEKCPNENAELIDLSSDDDDKCKNVGKEKKQQQHQHQERKTNGPQVNHGFSLETSVTLVPGSHVIRPPREDPVISITRKRKLQSGENYLQQPHLKRGRRDLNVLEEPRFTFADFGGNNKVLQEVCKLIVHIQHPEIYRQIGITPPRGFLLHGPPGCGKTLLANAIAGELDVHLVKVSAPELVAGVSGESEERIRELFDIAVDSAPCVLFIDEIDAITPNRETAGKQMECRIVAQLLTCLDELGSKPKGSRVLVIGATNRPDSLDPALRRAGRFDREVCLGIPDSKAREDILKVVCSKLKLSDGFSFEEIARNTPGYVGADLLSLAREAAMAAVNRTFGVIQHSQLNKARNAKKGKKTSPAKVGAVATATAAENGTDDAVTVVDIEVGDEKVRRGEESMEVCVTEATEEESTVKKNGVDCVGEQEEDVEKVDVGVENKEQDGEKTVAEVEDKEMDVEVDNKEKDGEKVVVEVDNKEKDGEKVVVEVDIKEKDAEKVVVEDDSTKTEDKNSKKAESDMDTSETDNVSSGVASDVKDVEEIGKDDKDDSCSESEEDESGPGPGVPVQAPTLETLLHWVRDVPPLTTRQLKTLCITQCDFDYALKTVQPSAKREGFATVPDVTWDDVGSLGDVREQLKMAILAPVRYPKQFEQLGLSTCAGVLLCGPPGCGKTLLAKAVANEAGINFISVKGPELLNMYVGESERAVRQCFQRARNSAPCVIFFDELDALCPKRTDSVTGNGVTSRVVNQMLTEMDGIESRKEVFLMAATNRPDIVDPAVLRPGRFDKTIYIGLPNQTDRVDILRALTKNGTRPKLSSDVVLEDVAGSSGGFTGADLAALVREAGVLSIKELFASSEIEEECEVLVKMKHFQQALSVLRPSVTKQDQLHYEQMKSIYTGRDGT